VAGDADQVAEQLRALGSMGYTDVIVRHFTSDHARVLGSFARLGEVRKALS
jgi:Na+(H+)/acetate symporter ActP